MEAEKIRLIIRKYLSEHPRNSAEIATWLSSQEGYSGSSDLALLMETDTSIVRIGTVRKSGMAGSTPHSRNGRPRSGCSTMSVLSPKTNRRI